MKIFPSFPTHVYSQAVYYLFPCMTTMPGALWGSRQKDLALEAAVSTTLLVHHACTQQNPWSWSWWAAPVHHSSVCTGATLQHHWLYHGHWWSFHNPHLVLHPPRCTQISAPISASSASGFFVTKIRVSPLQLPRSTCRTPRFLKFVKK